MRERIQTIIRAFQMTREVDPKLVPLLVGGALLGFAVTFGIGAFIGRPGLFAFLGVLVAILVALSVFGRRAQSAQFTAIEGQPGAAAAVLNSMRGQWFVTPVIAVTRKQEMVHRVIGRPGIVLVGEGGSPAKLKQLLAQERKKVARVAGEVPVHTVIVGDGPKQVELGKLQWHLTKLGNELSKREVPRLHRKLAPLDKGNVPIPKGFIPQNVSKKQR
jgi:hypothetical protein